MSNLELNCKWHFPDQYGGCEDGPNDSTQSHFKKTPYASLIRESIQNSLDAQLYADKPVEMHFAIKRIQAADYPNFFELQAHVKGCLQHFKNNSDAESVYLPMLEYLSNIDSAEHRGRLYYIQVSDRNTTGMNYVKGDTTTPFYAFVRSEGVTVKKSTSAGGSFGFGKAAYFNISPIRTIFVSTMTKDGKCFFEGESSLCTHELEGSDHLKMSVGYYDNNEGFPVENKEEIPMRFRREEPGTDICILGVEVTDPQSIYEEMIMAILQNFWMAIEKNKLVVTVGDVSINRDNIPILMEQYFPENKDVAAYDKNYNPRPYWDAVHNAGKDSHYVLIEENLPKLGHVSFYALKDKSATDKIIYMRKPLMLVKARRTQSSNGFYGVFVCDDPRGNELLRKMEDPAHKEWAASNWKEKGRNVLAGREAIDDLDKFIIHVMESMFSNLGQKVQQIQGLENFLYIPTDVEDDEDMDNESWNGKSIGIKDEEGNSLTTQASNDTSDTLPKEPTTGKIMIDNPQAGKLIKDKNGKELSGHGTRPKKHHGGGGLTPKDIDGRYTRNDEGVPGASLHNVSITYRAFAQVENGIVKHFIVLHSNMEVKNARIELVAGNEVSEDKVAIKSCKPETKIEDNVLSNLHLLEGKNVFEIEFADNMKHAIILKNYEIN